MTDMTDEQFEEEKKFIESLDDYENLSNEINSSKNKKEEGLTKEEIKEREELIWILFTLRQDADIEFTRKYV